MVCNTKVSYILSLNSCNEERSGNIKRKKITITNTNTNTVTLVQIQKKYERFFEVFR
jgi:hypothetical protein